MLNKDKKIKKIVEQTPSKASLALIDELEAKGVSLEEFSGGDFFERNQGKRLPLMKNRDAIVESKNLEYITNHISERQDVPGASLTSDPDKPYPWEQPPKFANPREAQDDMYLLLSEPEVAAGVVTALSNGLSVMDLTSLFIFSGFISGRFTPDVGLLLGEATAYFIMGLGELANIEYQIEDDDTDLDEFIEGDIAEQIMQVNGMQRLKELSSKKDVTTKDIPPEILTEIKTRVEPSLLIPKTTEPTLETEPEQQDEQQTLLGRTE
tara:strand:+ start:2624 stop:3421 length:798 start_codon:yes stop_codon:yes gene_type:complete